MTCRDCREGLEHCHGVLVVHPDGASDCAEERSCGAVLALHEWQVSCDEVGCPCSRSPESAPLPAYLVAA